MSQPTKELERLVLSGRLRHGGNPIARWMADNLEVKHGPAGTVYPVKPKNPKSQKKIDGMVALIMALDRATRLQPTPSVYEERGILLL